MRALWPLRDSQGFCSIRCIPQGQGQSAQGSKAEKATRGRDLEEPQVTSGLSQPLTV